MPFDELWNNIRAHAGEEFQTATGRPFTYEAHEGYIKPNRAEQNISRSDFEKAYDLAPLQNPGQISKVVRGPSYVYAILTDPRIHDLFPIAEP
jgi:hypothetical protein